MTKAFWCQCRAKAVSKAGAGQRQRVEHLPGEKLGTAAADTGKMSRCCRRVAADVMRLRIFCCSAQERCRISVLWSRHGWADTAHVAVARSSVPVAKSRDVGV